MGLWRDAGEGHRQPRHKGDAIRNGYRTYYCSPGDGRIPVRHKAQDTSITEGTAILQSGGVGGSGRWLVRSSHDEHGTVRVQMGFERFLLGSVFHAIVHRAVRSVLVIR
jgi:hypothetical protein